MTWSPRRFLPLLARRSASPRAAVAAPSDHRAKAASSSRPSSHWPRVLQLVRPHRGRVALLASSSFLAGASEAAFLVTVTRTALTIAAGGGAIELAPGVTVSIGAAITLGAALLSARLMLALAGVSAATSLTVDVSTSLRRRLSGSYLRASWATQQSEPAGQLQQLVTAFVGSATQVVGAFATMVAASLNLAALILVVVVVDPTSTLVVLAALAALSAILAPIRRRIRLRSGAAATAQMAFANSVSELGALGLEMQAYGVRERFARRVEGLIDAEARARRRAVFLGGALSPAYTTLAFVAILVALGLASAVGSLQLHSLGAVMLVMLRSLGYGQQLQVASSILLGSLPFLERLDSTVERYDAERATDGNETLERIGALETRGVSFAYRSGDPVLQDITFRIDPGEVVGIVGPSGSGKTTLVQLLLGLREPSTGSVHVGGVDLRKVDRTGWRGRVAFVAQDALLFTGTVAENIRFFREGIDDAAVRGAAIRANLDVDIQAMPAGYDTHLGERGTSLSGGQRQRLSIARALAGRPELLILDEPTSALDVRSESLVRDTIAALRGSATVIVIAHRISTLEGCDRIMVIEKGRLAGFDTPGNLQRRSDFFREALELSGLG